ncbi:sigma-70 family rna polymerase sigma factor : RNA polymerase sigma factor, sigma-70 family OS=Singulisphaera acidiphila (strain ATCC BAA-1392 / DSM 18658 / VKM B-2454 / MOB10) GN=Sinac_3619 PE=4 SV=1: Sigma70_r2 [Gemmataceae bacterium]|nr:sigma-70 family rna polymerase sigma factor : RNA polymerase sigma factor, sigma-70 family OS=Singulisphaera acidiphila (strain ATCC BAA-1392 / DSM 18658 / VKM B-2454 / MOB10) GN=Sinac_3619 PE=4 SV=1: Sigma70_r2 [Gemmataceae bacterium]VTU02233.1 sigma-70 family rna polymerase sigma factor : RNA polymerase sigma factor, sigma-70 family OS=Singulisphaera acidiphila (strain ATCC BAA-1392 / DSM 18658 / VKM B-2454 / MOB10) GN=Sinac_3619 PE=4 SV=1: Sigma70_r2 [Gemmataceae bacterium]
MDTPAARTSVTLLARLGGASADAAAWEEFLRRYGPQVLGWCRHWNLQDADAEDVAQDVLLRVSKQMRTFRYDPGRSFRGWLKTVARAAWSDWLDARRRAVLGSGDTGVRHALESAEARDDLVGRLEAEFDRELLDTAAAQVRLRVEPRTWDAFALTAIDGLSGAEAAAKLGMKVAAVYVAKGRVQKMLQDEVRSLDLEEA